MVKAYNNVRYIACSGNSYTDLRLCRKKYTASRRQNIDSFILHVIMLMYTYLTFDIGL